MARLTLEELRQTTLEAGRKIDTIMKGGETKGEKGVRILFILARHLRGVDEGEALGNRIEDFVLNCDAEPSVIADPGTPNKGA